MFRVLVLNAAFFSHDKKIFEGQASSVCIPGAEGEFEILDFHKPILSRLKKGVIVVDNSKEIPVKGGIMKMDRQSLIAMVEL